MIRDIVWRIYYNITKENVKEKLAKLLCGVVHPTICCGATKYRKVFLQISLQKIVVPEDLLCYNKGY